MSRHFLQNGRFSQSFPADLTQAVSSSRRGRSLVTQMLDRLSLKLLLRKRRVLTSCALRRPSPQASHTCGLRQAVPL